MLKLGIVGCGAIGTEICKAVDEGSIESELVAVYDRNKEHLSSLQSSLLNTEPVVYELQEMVKHVDLVVESASQNAAYEIVTTALESSCDVMVMSVGAFVDKNFREKVTDIAKQKGCKIYLPSGALVGLDGVKTASCNNIYSVSLTSRKPPESLEGAPYIVENNIDLENLKNETVVFEGSAAEAVKMFPANVNVAATLSLSGIGFDETSVKIIADPGAEKNIHNVTVKGNFGEFTTRVENLPSPTNPKTSYLASLSAIATLKNIVNPLQVGT
ncbi:Aspartate dehydrogenase [Methanohalobium evestigatum Z-7303]|uniref:L-aspartate dehydrogenase n=1 Tax=Methanohalobium evestigatum (strain ATCC BAA-1072 / DSM 3721 / NBRC 107634 / OCM 161 / Z-7303) TaxID=644295 RepID=D7E7F8_METEZ|nr:aspartate dehydrogenase [Methanohalobium evestigatum]ADI73907.1 Aspartate dehydrogenase [Methanohalobium evestigatum Z-7303]